MKNANWNPNKSNHVVNEHSVDHFSERHCYSDRETTNCFTCSDTRQRPFGLWLTLQAWTHTPQAFLETSQAGHILPRHNRIRPQHWELRALLFSNSAWVLYLPQDYEQWRTARRDLRSYRPCPRRLESLTTCRCNYKGSTFYSVI